MEVKKKLKTKEKKISIRVFHKAWHNLSGKECGRDLRGLAGQVGSP